MSKGKKGKSRKVHVNKYEQHSRVEEVKRDLESGEKKRAERAKRKVQKRIVGNIYGGGTDLYRFMVQPEGYYIDYNGNICSDENDLTRLF